MTATPRSPAPRWPGWRPWRGTLTPTCAGTSWTCEPRHPNSDRTSRRLAATWTDICSNYGIQTSLSIAPGLEEGNASRRRRVAQVFRIVQEALSNARRHGSARKVQVVLDAGGGLARLAVQDDGAGFDPKGVAEGECGRFGLQFMRERAEGVGGRLQLHSAPGEGTRIVVEVPLRDGVDRAALAGMTSDG